MACLFFMCVKKVNEYSVAFPWVTDFWKYGFVFDSLILV